ncbi:MAG TPA: hypothetical protein VGL08_19320 [Paraburkholderia sp.]
MNLITFAAKRAPLQRIVTRNDAMQVAECRFVECKFAVLHEREQMIRTVRQIQDLVLVGAFPAADRRTTQKRQVRRVVARYTTYHGIRRYGVRKIR